MRRSQTDDYKKLVPLKRIAQASSYSFGYVSILVQRKKLKAKKIGNKYYSTREWFDQYLELYAQNKKRLSLEVIKELSSGAVAEPSASESLASAKLKSQIDNLVDRAIKEKLAAPAKPEKIIVPAVSLDDGETEKKDTDKSIAIAANRSVCAEVITDEQVSAGSAKKSLAGILNNKIAASEARLVADLVEPEKKLSAIWSENIRREEKDLKAAVRQAAKKLSVKKIIPLQANEISGIKKITPAEKTNGGGEVKKIRLFTVSVARGIASPLRRLAELFAMTIGMLGYCKKIIKKRQLVFKTSAMIAIIYLVIFSFFNLAPLAAADLSLRLERGLNWAAGEAKELAAKTVNSKYFIQLSQPLKKTRELAERPGVIIPGKTLTAKIKIPLADRLVKLAGQSESASLKLENSFKARNRIFVRRLAAVKAQVSFIGDFWNRRFIRPVANIKLAARVMPARISSLSDNAVTALKSFLNFKNRPTGRTDFDISGQKQGEVAGAVEVFPAGALPLARLLALANTTSRRGQEVIGRVKYNTSAALENTADRQKELSLSFGRKLADLTLSGANGVSLVSKNGQQKLARLEDAIKETNETIKQAGQGAGQSVQEYNNSGAKYLAGEAGRSLWSLGDLYSKIINRIIPESLKTKYAKLYEQPQIIIEKEVVVKETTTVVKERLTGKGDNQLPVKARQKTVIQQDSIGRSVASSPITDNLSITGNANVGGELNVSGPVKLKNKLTVLGQTDFNADVTVAAALTAKTLLVTDYAQFAGSINAKDLTADNLTSRNNLTVVGDSFIGGNELISGNLKVSGTFQAGHTEFASLGVTGQLGAGSLSAGSGGLVVNGNSHLGGAVDLNEILDIDVKSGSALTVGDGSTDYFTVNTAAGGSVTIAAALNSSAVATSTFAGGIRANVLDIISTTATSTFANGINLANGCFSVNGTCVSGGGSGTVNSGATGQISYYAADGTALTATSSLFIHSNQNLGLGTTTPTFGKLDIDGNLAIENQNGLRLYEARANGINYAGLTATSSMAGDITWTLPDADGTSGKVLATNGSGNLYWATAGGGLTGSTGQLAYFSGTDTAVGTSTIFISTAQKIGIGTTTPNWLLQAAGTRPSFVLSDTSAAANNKHWFMSSQGGNFYVGTSSDSYATSTISALTILANSNLGIGTSSPFAKFSVAGNIGADYITAVSLAATSTFPYLAVSSNSNLGTVVGGTWQGTAIANIYGGTGQNSSAWNGPISAANGVWSATTSIGVIYGGTGSTTLSGILKGNGAGQVQTALAGVDYQAAGSYLTALSNNSLTKGYLIVGDDAGLSQATSTMFISSTGNLGIGTTSPNSLLSLYQASADTALTFGNSSATMWTMGTDISDGSKFKIASSSALGTNDRLTIDTNGNIGLGTSSPLAKLSVQGTAGNNIFDVASSTGQSLLTINNTGQCVTGDTELPIVKSEEFSTFNFQFSNKSQIKNVQIKDIKGGEMVLSLNEKTGKLVPAKIKGLLDMGVKPIYKITTEDGKTIRTTGNHPYLAKQKTTSVKEMASQPAIPTADLLYHDKLSQTKWTKVVYLDEGDEIAVADESLAAFFGNQDNQRHSDDQKSAKNVKGSHSIGDVIHNYSFNIDKLNTQQNNDRSTPEIIISQFIVPPITGSISIEAKNTWPMSRSISENIFSLSDDNSICLDNSKNCQVVSNESETADIKFVRIAKIELLPAEQVYDIEVEGTHNFVGNGIIAHNTYINGNLGIGTTSPNWLLQAAGTRPFFTLSDTSAAANNQHWFMSSQGGNFYVGTSSDSYATSTISALTILANSSLGVGTSSPFAKFSVAGNIGADYITAVSQTATSTFPYLAVSTNSNLGTVVGGTWQGTAIANTYGGTGQNSSAWNGPISAANGVWSATTSIGVIYGGTGSTTLSGLLKGNGTGQVQTALAGTDYQAAGSYLTALSNNALTKGYFIVGDDAGLSQATSTMFIASTGKLGIGTTTPNSLLSLYQASSDTALTFGNSNATMWTMGADISDGSKFKIASSSALGTNDRLTIDTNGNVGLGTSSPLAKLSVQGTAGNNIFDVASSTGQSLLTINNTGQCVTGDTKLRRRRRKKQGSADDDDEEDWEDIEIKDIKPGDEILTMDEATGKLVVSKVNALMDMGIKPIYKITTASGKTIRTTENHPYYAKAETASKQQKFFHFEIDQSIRIEKISQNTIIGLANKENNFTAVISAKTKRQLFEIYRRAGEKKLFAPMVLAATIVAAARLAPFKVRGITVDIEYPGYENKIIDFVHWFFPEMEINFMKIGKKSLAHFAAYGVYIKKRSHDRWLGYNEISNLIQTKKTLRTVTPLDKSQTIRSPHGPLQNTSRHSIYKNSINNSSVKSGDWTKVKYLKVGQKIAIADKASKRAVWDKIIKIEHLPEEQVYDIEVEGTHNFVGNGIIAHNTYINGNVGIGTTTPNWLLQAAGTRPSFALSDTSAGTNNKHWLFSSMGGSLYIGTSTDSYATSTPAALTILNSGNIGIGTTGPGYKLEVTSADTVGIYTNKGIQSATNIFSPIIQSPLIYPSAAVDLVLQTRAAGTNNIIFKSVGTTPTETMRLDTNGNVGIGTTSPFGLLSVNANGLTAGAPQFVVGSSTATNFIVANNGNVGVGSTSPISPLTVYGAGSFGDSITSLNATRALNLISTNAVMKILRISADVDASSPAVELLHRTTADGVNTGYWDFFLNSSGFNIRERTVSNITRLTIASSTGNLGLGTTTPNSLLSLYQASADTALSFGNSNATMWTMGTDISDGSKFKIASSSALGTNDRLTIDTNGNIGIGTTSPGSLLSLGNTGANTINISTTATSTFGSGINVLTGCFAINGTCVSGGSGSGTVNSGTTGQISYYAADGTALTATSSLFIHSNQNVGLGTTTPNWLLQAAGTRPFFTLSDTGAAADQKHWFLSSQGGNFYVGQATDAYSTTTSLTILNGGNVGIGTTSPAERLSVNGNTEVIGSFTAGFASWSQVGNSFATSTGNPALAALNSTDMAFYDTTSDKLRTMRFNGTNWTQVGADFATSSSGSPALAALNSTDVAFMESTNDALTLYRFDGTNWAQVGNGLGITTAGVIALAALNSTDVAFLDATNDQLRTYRFDGTNWAQVGNGLGITGSIISIALTTLNSTDVAFLDAANEQLRVYRFDGTNWTQVGNDLDIAVVGAPALATLNSTDVAMIDSNNLELRTYRFSGTTWAQFGSSFSIGASVGVMALAAVGNSSAVAYIDGTNDVLRNIKFSSAVSLIGKNGMTGIGTTNPNYSLDIRGSGTVDPLEIASSTGTSLMRLNTLGNLGIGTTTPFGLLSVNANGLTAGAPQFVVGSSTATHFIITNGGNTGIGTTSPYSKLALVDNTTSLRDVFTISTSTSGLVFKVDSYGATYADGAYTSPAADYAEYFYTNSVDLKSGEIVCVDILENNAVKRCERGADNNIMGIVSSRPSVIGNYIKEVRSNPAHYAIIGMLGQVDAYVSAENGPINIGDSLTSASSTPGYARRANGGDSTVAVALEPLKNGVGKIKVLISRRNKSLAVEEVEALVIERIANMKIEDQVQRMIKQSVDNLNLDPKIFKIAQEEAGKLDALLSVSINDVNGQISLLQDKIFNFQFSIFNEFSKINDQINVLNLRTDSMASSTALSENIKIDESGNLVIGKTSPQPSPSQGEGVVQIVDITEIVASSTRTALVVNQQGHGQIADFQSQGVTVMNIAENGTVKIVGSMLVDGRIMLCAGGYCSNALDAAVDETMADLGVEGKVVAGAFEGYCADGYIWAPGSAKYGTLPGFCVMSDLTVESESVPDAQPRTNISQGQAQYACQSLGAGYHLLGENEWLTLAENILRVAANDLASSTALKLTNDNVINNLTGSIAEWTNQNVTSAGLPVTPERDSWYEYGEVVDFKGLNLAPDYYLTDANNHIGKIYVGSGTGLRGFVRGSGGIYGLDLSHSPAEQSESIGFRCAK